ncbi:MAG: sigma-70 family RNA polymerase sigma factor [Pleurocapsa sp. MO_226.B13]|nr:sigma-70 family RNA polymerase sigma factor [Pleurocapsa sp. MO_226.B13]
MTPRLRRETLISLVEQARTGDRSAYSQIVKQFQDLAVGYAYSILRNFPEAEEAAQEAFIEAYFNLTKLRNPAAFGGWLKKIIFKYCDRFIRGKRPAFVSLTQTEELISSQPSPLSIAETRELQAQIGQVIELLPETEREVITLFYLGDRSQNEISAFLEIPISTIKNRLYSARNRLKPELMNMVENYLENQCPSQDDTFANKVTQTLEAALDGDKETIRTLIQQDTRLVNSQSKNIQTTPLHIAAHRGYSDLVKLLLDAGADVNAEEGNYSKSTPLHWAAKEGNLQVVKLLVESGAKLDVKDNWFNLTPFGWTILVNCPFDEGTLENLHPQVREYLLDRGAQLDIFSAIALDKTDVVKSLIEANPNILSDRLGFVMDEFQPLHFAIKKMMPETVEFLLEKGADVNALTSLGVTPLCMATKIGDRQIIELLMAKNADVALDTLIVAQEWEQAQALFEAQPKIITQKPLLLHYTIRRGLTAATSWLLERGADIEIRTKYLLDDFVASLTPLQAAIEAERVEIARILIEAGANVDAKTIGELELTALQDAAAMGNLDLIRLLVKHQADLAARDNVYNGTPLDWAKAFEQQAAIELLQQLETEKL